MNDDEDYESNEDHRELQLEKQPNKAKTFVVPKSKTKLRACEKCRLIKTQEQWIQQGRCQNHCREFKDDEDLKKYTSNKFEHMVAIIEPAKSWLRRKLLLNKHIVSGVYAVNLL